MKRTASTTLAAAMAMALTGHAAAVTLDGSTAGDGYGSALAVQTVETGFGDNQSELNAAYAQISGGTLYLTITGQVESNFNKLNIFFDTVAGGQNTLNADANNGGTNPENDNWANSHNGFTFDTGFDADYVIIVRSGNFGGDKFDIDIATVGGGLGAFESAGDVFGGSFTGTNAAALPLAGVGVAYDNSNAAGIGGTAGNAADQSAAQAVTTGFELAIPLSAIGSPAGDFKVSAMVNNSNHNYLSNQFLGGLPVGQGNLGGDGAGTFTGNVGGIDLNNFAGNQYFIVPEPTSLALLGLGGLLVARRRRA